MRQDDLNIGGVRTLAPARKCRCRDLSFDREAFRIGLFDIYNDPFRKLEHDLRAMPFMSIS